MAKIFLTGADGFIGSHLAELLIRRGHHVRALVQYNSFGHQGWLRDLPAEVYRELEIVPGDVRDAYQMKALAQGQDWLIHLAALIGIPYSYQAPASYVQTNVQGTLHVLEAAQAAQCQKILITSTSEVYGTAHYVPIDEAHPLQPQSPYSASKVGADSLALAYARSFGLPVTLVRPFNTYGPRQSYRAIIPSIIGQLLGGAPALQLGDLRPTRDLLFVRDNARAYLSIAEAEVTPGQTFNLATGQEFAMQQVADTLIELIQPGTPIIQDPARLRPVASEVMRLCGDATLLREQTGWQPEYDLRQGLTETIAWFRTHPAHGQHGGDFQV